MDNTSEVKMTTIDPFNMLPGIEESRKKNRRKVESEKLFTAMVAAMQGLLASAAMVTEYHASSNSNYTWHELLTFDAAQLADCLLRDHERMEKERAES